MRSFFIVLSLLLTASCASAAEPITTRTVEHLGDWYTVVTMRLGGDADLRLYGGQPGGLTFVDTRDATGHENRTVVALMNGGMYGTDTGPVGLFIANGVERHSIDLGSGEGNFYLKPNGVFWLDTKSVAHVTASGTFPTDRSGVTLATQSGPMLLVDGVVPLVLWPDSPNKLRRNGVGVSADGKTVNLVISEGNVRFYDMATLFRDTLACDDALYLDGVVSKLWTSGNVPTDKYGAVIAVTRKSTP